MALDENTSLLTRIAQLDKNTEAIRQQMSNVFEECKTVSNKGWGINIRTGILNNDKNADPALLKKYIDHLDSNKDTLQRLMRLMPSILTEHQQRLKKIDSLLQSINKPLAAAGNNREDVLDLLEDNYSRWLTAVQAGEELLALMQSDAGMMQKTVNQLRVELSAFPDSDAAYVTEKDVRKEPATFALLLVQAQQQLDDVLKYFENLHNVLSGLYHSGMALINEIEPWFSKLRNNFPDEVSPELREFILGMSNTFPPFAKQQSEFFELRDKELDDWPNRLVKIQEDITRCRHNPKHNPADLLDLKDKLRKLLTEMETTARQAATYTKQQQDMQKFWKDGAKWRG